MIKEIEENKIKNIIENAKNTSKDKINTILKKAHNMEGLSPEEVATLLWCEDKSVWEEISKIAYRIKEEIYGDRIVMFAPLYVSNYCVNKCTYCGFSHDNKFRRRRLSMDEVKAEVQFLEKTGHKRLALEAGEDPVNCDIDYILDCINTIYDTHSAEGDIRRINVNIAATTVENYKKLKEASIGTYILFQETYHKPTYEKVHVAGPKSNYEYHTMALHRAMEAGIDDVGAGVLFGLYDYKYEILSLMLHNKSLEDMYNVGFHTVSVPRLCRADGQTFDDNSYLIDDETFKKIVAIIRIAIPFTGIIMSTRETAEMRKDLLALGVSQTSGGSSTIVGGYTTEEKQSTQFDVSDERPVSEIADWLLDENLIPSFCTACYRQGRTGDRFMSLAKSGNIKNVCLPNALMTLKEYAEDYGDDTFKNKVNKSIEGKINNILNDDIKKLTEENLKKIENGERDLYI